MSSLFAKCRNAPWLVFALVFAWKIALFALSAQPVPSNDAYFYDGAVVNQLLHGGYFNPSIARVLPISGTEVFSAYPPLYQATLWMWMSVFGTSALSAMSLHLVLFGGYALVVYLILKRIQSPVWCFHMAGCYLLLLTFHDRPDSLAHLLGMLAIYAWICSRRIFNDGTAPAHATTCLWAMALFTILALCTSLQIGAIYLLWIWLGMLVTTVAGKEKFPALPMLTTVVVPAVLLFAVKLGCPHLWAGFLEHARQTPSLTGWRLPAIGDVLKVLRTTPGICLVAIFLPWSWFQQHNDIEHVKYARHEFVLVPALLAAVAVVVACLFILTPNTVAIANYLQPVIVASYLAFCATILPHPRNRRLQVACLSLAVMIGSARAIGMSTWGLACATDVSYSSATHRIEAELAALPPGSTVVISSPFLYGAAKYKELSLVHSDWMGKAWQIPPLTDLQALEALRPRKMILSQFDFYRRHEPVLEQLQKEPGLCEVSITNTARIPAPDSYPPLRRVVQHVSWAPIIVDLDWHGPP
ncbi:MAG TPA: hypothetical protein VN048_12155 [Verrucomicrobiae bacterium]|jgi:hypothetical protein|nr:hypothetical protein [Verrucomicrobiae bacterium]